MSPAPSQESELVTISVRVTRSTAERFKRVADAEYRPVAAALRRLIEEHCDRFEQQDAAA